MKKITVKGFKGNQEIEIKASNLFLGASDYLRSDNMDFAKPIVDEFIRQGGNAFDTARHYRHGEKAISTWMKLSNTKREDIVLFTKCCHPVREFPDTPRVNAKGINEDVEVSLQMLETDYVDMLALHRDDESVSVKEIMDELNRQIELGRVRAIGVSNWSLERIIEANEYAKNNGLKPLTFNSPNLSLARPKRPRWPGCVSADDAMIKWHEANDMALVSWSSQAGGFFSGRFAKDKLDDEEMVDCFYNDANWEKFDRCKILGEAKGCSLIQIALAWVLNQSFEVAAAIGCENKDELLSSLEGATITITEQEMKYLNLEADHYE